MKTLVRLVPFNKGPRSARTTFWAIQRVASKKFYPKTGRQWAEHVGDENTWHFESHRLANDKVTELGFSVCEHPCKSFDKAEGAYYCTKCGQHLTND